MVCLGKVESPPCFVKIVTPLPVGYDISESTQRFYSLGGLYGV